MSIKFKDLRARISKNYKALDSDNVRAFGYLIIGVTVMTMITGEAFAQTNAGGSLDFLSRFIKEITQIIKNEGKIALEVLSAGAGGYYGAKTGSWPPVLVGGTAAGMIEMLFSIIG